MIETVPSGTVLHGRYRIERVLGSGGFGHVYLAVDLVTNEQYALKEYLVSGAGGQEQLKHEASVLSQLHHPNLPAFHDAFNERGRYYVVLNYIEGNDLTDLIRMANRRNEVVPIPQVLQWLVAICDAVLFLHSQNPPVIHRDIKPDNIRIMPNGVATLVDLGNAKASADGARTLFFIRHQGTPGYAPPEQYPGGSGTDTRSDIYALGGTLYFALTSQEPPSVSIRNQAIQQNKPDLPSLQELLANNPPEDSPEANAARQFRLGVSKPAKPAPRHSRHLAQLGMLSPALLNQLNRIIQKAMATKPKDRYHFVADLAGDLRKVAQALPPSMPPPSTTRPPDPHGTQPDLPMLYEALQAAKDTASPAAPESKPVAPSVNHCPRCNNVLAPGTAFCPRCGTSINNAPKATMHTTSPSSINPSSASSTGKRDITDDKTRVITPQARLGQSAMGYAPRPITRTSSAPVDPSTPRTIMGVPGNLSQRNTAMAMPQSPSISASTPAQNYAPSTQQSPPSTSRFTIEPRMVIFMMVVLVVLLVIAILLLLLINQGHKIGALVSFIPCTHTIFSISYLSIRSAGAMSLLC